MRFALKFPSIPAALLARRRPSAPTDPALVGTLDTLAEAPAEAPVVLAGDLVLIMFGDVPNAAPAGHSRTPDLAPGIQAWVRDEVAPLVGARRVAFAATAYLAWARSKRFTGVLVAGFSGDDASNIEVYRFERGVPRAIQEHVLPSQSDALRFASEFSLLREELVTAGWPESPWFHAAPLAPIVDCEPMGPLPLSRLRWYADGPPAHGATTPWVRWGGVGLLATMGPLLFAGAYFVGAWQHQSVVDQYQQAAAQLPRQMEVTLDRLEAMRGYLADAVEAGAPVKRVRPLLESAARIPGVVIRSLTLGLSPPTGEASRHTVELILAVPAEGPYGVVQSEGLNRALVLPDHAIWIESHRDQQQKVRGRPVTYRIFVIRARPLEVEPA